MANPSTPSRAPRNAPQRKPHRYIDALFADDFGRRSKLTTYSANSFAKKKYDAASQALQLKGERREKQLRRIEIREWRAAERSVTAEQRESDHRIRLMWRTLNTKVRPEKTLRYTPPRERQRTWPYAAIALPKYDGPVIDRNGQRGVFMRVRYYSRRTAGQGVSQRVVKYCFNGAEVDAQGNPYVATNIGATIDETLCGFDHLEQVNWAAQKNAKLLLHCILAVDHRQTPDEMMTCGLRWAEETLGRFDLPYLVTLHAPPPDGDQRNWHLHVLWSFRPMVRTGDHEWQVAEMLRTDLDNPVAMKLFREMFAGVMTEMSYETGQNQVWTAKSNADRGLPHEPQVHLGGADTNRARNGEYVAANEENHERVMRSKAAVIDDKLRHADEALAKMQDAARAIAARFGRFPVLPMPLPKRVAASTMLLEQLTLRSVPPVSTASFAVPVIPPLTIAPGRISETSFDPPPAYSTRPASLEIGNALTPQSIPRSENIEIANLRIRLPPRAKQSGTLLAAVPVTPAKTTAPAIPELAMRSPKRAEVCYLPVMPPRLPKPVVPQLPALSSSSSEGALADTRNLDSTIARSLNARRRDDERRERENETIARAEREARAAALQTAIDRQLLKATPSAKKRRSSGWEAARHLRQQALADWDDTEGPNDVDRARPGRAPLRPGADRSMDRPTRPHRLPPPPSRDVGD
jgi:hypothetical protein